MNTANLKTALLGTGLLVCLALAGTLTGCASSSNASRPNLHVDNGEDYVYYPDYGIYYSMSNRQYVYLEGDTWSRSASPSSQVSVGALRASRSVHMLFHDSPEEHNAEVLKDYPGAFRDPGGEMEIARNRVLR